MSARRSLELRARVVALALGVRFGLRNRLSRSPVTGEGGAVVSLTTYGRRTALVHLAIESIAAGAVRPRRFILWVDEPETLARPPRALRRLRCRGLEILATENYGPHTKYYPYVAAGPAHEVPLVTADDDTLYPRGWLAGLLAVHATDPTAVVAYRAWHMTFAGAGLAPYESWPRCRSTTASPLHFATGVAGVLYPPAVLEALRAAGPAFKSVCPSNDDVWLNATALRAGAGVRQVSATARDFPIVLRTGASGLFGGVNAAGGNDRQLRATYTEDEIDTLAALDAADA